MVLVIDFGARARAYPGGVPKTQSSTTPEGLQEDGEKIAKLIRPIVSAIAETASFAMLSKGHVNTIEMRAFQEGPPKTMFRMNEKARDEYEGSYVDIRDARRCRMDLRDPTQIAAFCATVDWIKKEEVPLPHGAFICIAENRFVKPTDSGYSSHKANIVVPIPDEPDRHHIFELMTVHGEFERMIESDKKNRLSMGSHGAYDVKRKLDGMLATGRFEPDMIKYYAMVDRVTKQIHAKARQACDFSQIDCSPFEKFLANETLEAYERALG